ncbi:precorrin-2 C(20)-methyltransferase [Massilia antarctica]|uniref:precorrin-2 C(20)-methyltransferase n=1 Tax=Massilia antarctica TaxID=2765360 RepID=UPI0006BB62DE|nr:precorrin-2 C(20)-methyltransferase [Massilia sp. H27-R4]MCY0910760.1 precorrin-2 C(20)-methyltransferase [Massilia sp. H27-R4]CUI08860.1 Cobalt-precorrin-2 C20-methyltransferase [Janthinobacterium sp. CG23_2]CUU32646.1 Cobalt-precorrin-2 C20-methyltransferase [Janthinobacterium sp. CG23_2]
MSIGTLWGIGVGPGPAGYLPLAALDALRRADLIFAPRARGAELSVALQCLAGIDIDPAKLREIEFNMDPDRSVLSEHYAQLADTIALELRAGRDVAYLTIGDSLTYSTYGYVLAALRARIPDLPQRTFPGITSYAAAASALAWPLGEGKERVLILPCPETAEELRSDILTHDIVVLMKVGARLGWVLDLLRDMGIADHCAFARRIGLPGELLASGVGDLVANDAMGYLATLLVRHQPRQER